MSNIMNFCPVLKLDGGLSHLHFADECVSE